MEKVPFSRPPLNAKLAGRSERINAMKSRMHGSWIQVFYHSPRDSSRHVFGVPGKSNVASLQTTPPGVQYQSPGVSEERAPPWETKFDKRNLPCKGSINRGESCRSAASQTGMNARNDNGRISIYLTLAGYLGSALALSQGGARSSLTLGFVIKSLRDFYSAAPNIS